MPLRPAAIAKLAETREKIGEWPGGFFLEGNVYRLAGRRRMVVDRVRVGPPDIGADFTVQTILGRM